MSDHASFPLGKQAFIIREGEAGYDMFLSDGIDEVKVMAIKSKSVRICGEQFELYEGQMFYDRAGRSTKAELPFPGDESEDPVIQRPDRTLYCIKCGCKVPNTANNEMRRDGFYSHSHVCDKLGT